ncbi:MAG: hypothetical protein ACE5K8_08685 [Candidatus Zixiibacteriota bacterium]
MRNRKQYSAYAKELAESLTSDNISLIDFDRLRSWLLETASAFEEIVRLKEEVEHLRQDYIGRIAGMTKAIAAVNRHPDGWESALAFLETLPSLGAVELIEQYRVTSARFRDAFPTSFGLLTDRKRRSDVWHPQTSLGVAPRPQE